MRYNIGTLGNRHRIADPNSTLTRYTRLDFEAHTLLIVTSCIVFFESALVRANERVSLSWDPRQRSKRYFLFHRQYSIIKNTLLCDKMPRYSKGITYLAIKHLNTSLV